MYIVELYVSCLVIQNVPTCSGTTGTPLDYLSTLAQLYHCWFIFNSRLEVVGCLYLYTIVHASLGYVTILLDDFLLMHGYYIRYCIHIDSCSCNYCSC